jgi:hypothetical protein
MSVLFRWFVVVVEERPFGEFAANPLAHPPTRPRSMRGLLLLLLGASASCALEFSPASLSVSKARDGSDKREATATFPQSASGAALQASQDDDLAVAFKLTDNSRAVAPDQVMLVLQGEKHDYAVAARTPNEGSTEFTLHLPLSKAWETLPSGEYDVVVYVSGAGLPEAKKWRVGKLNVKFDPRPLGMPPPLFAHQLLYDSDVATAALPEIHHQFRAPDHRAPHLIAFSVTGIICFFFCTFVLASLKVSGGKLISVFASPISLAFALNLLALLGLFLWYWAGPALKGPTMNELWVWALPVSLCMLFVVRGAVGANLQQREKTKPE